MKYNSRTGYENKMKSFQGQIGQDEFGINRIYVNIEDIPNDMLEELKKEIEFCCSDCNNTVNYLVINMLDFKDYGEILKGSRRQTWADMYFDCGNCAIGG